MMVKARQHTQFYKISYLMIVDWVDLQGAEF